MRQRTRQASLVVLFAGLVGALGASAMGAGAAHAQGFGTVVAVEGTAEIGHDGAFAPATIGAPVQRGDEIRTTRPGGRLSVVSLDDSVLNIGEGVDLTIDDFVFEPRQKLVRSLVRLKAGKIRPLVSAYYQRAGGVYEIETGTALVGVHSTEFVVAYDPVAEVSEVVGVTGRVEVHGLSERPGRRGVFVTTKELTTVAKGKLPTAAQTISDKLFRQYIEGLEFIGNGQAESQIVKHPLLAGEMVPPPDHLDALPPVPGGGPAPGEGAPNVGPPPPIRRPPWPLIVTGPGEDWPGTCTTLGCFSVGPPGASRSTGDIGIKF